ncbi:MAG: M48 family metalloprotease [Pseudomonadota bacterium]
MFFKLQNFNSVAGFFSHYSGLALLGSAALAIAQPWTLIVSGAFTTGLMAWSLKSNKDVLENGLLKHPRAHKFSPNLQRIVDRLFERSGLGEHEAVVYDFQTKVEPDKKEGLLHKLIKRTLDNVASVPNAAAFNMGKPVIIISEPLLELLDDDEEEAVLAHEFAHAAAKHQHVALPHKLLSSVMKVSNSLVVLNEMINAGVVGISLSLVAAGTLSSAVKRLHPKGHLLEDEDDSDTPVFLRKREKTMRELAEIKSVKKFNAYVSGAGATAVTSLFNPLYLPIRLLAGGINLSATFLEKSFSRNKEYQADRGATVLGASPLAMITSLRKLSEVQKRSIQKAWYPDQAPQSGKLSKKWKEQFTTHPSIEKRIGRLVGIAKQQGYSEFEIHKAVHGRLRIPNTVNIPESHIIETAKAFLGQEDIGIDMVGPLKKSLIPSKLHAA